MFEDFVSYIFNIFHLFNSSFGFTLFCMFSFLIMIYIFVRIFKR